MNILIIGSGGREHALVWKVSQSPLCGLVYIAPGNAGTALTGTNLDIDSHDFEGLGKALVERKIELVICGPEAPLVNGIRDFFENDPRLREVIFIGPGKEGARLEASKSYAKRFMNKFGIPAPRRRVFTKDTLAEGLNYLESGKAPYVLKADGLTGGKGVVICDNLLEAKEEFANIISGEKFGDAGKTVLIEDYLQGKEVSVFIFTDGLSYLLLPTATDYKRLGEGNTGPNTGGMAALSPSPYEEKKLMDKIRKRIIAPTLNGMQKEGIRYSGFLYFGIMCVDGNPFLLEYNCRLGDPEAQAILPRMKVDLIELFQNSGRQKLSDAVLETDERPCAAIMLVSKGYPGKSEDGKKISGLENSEGSLVFHSGTKRVNQDLYSLGGRVLSVASSGESISSALKKAYAAIAKINFEGKYFRKDIGKAGGQPD